MVCTVKVIGSKDTVKILTDTNTKVHHSYFEGNIIHIYHGSKFQCSNGSEQDTIIDE